MAAARSCGRSLLRATGPLYRGRAGPGRESAKADTIIGDFGASRPRSGSAVNEDRRPFGSNRPSNRSQRDTDATHITYSPTRTSGCQRRIDAGGGRSECPSCEGKKSERHRQ